METTTIRGPWDIYCRLVRHLPEEDAIDFAERAPRSEAPDGRGCVYTVPAAEGAVIGWLHRYDYRQEHMSWQVRRDGTWHHVSKEEAYETAAPGIWGRWQAKEAHRQAMEMKYRLIQYCQPRGAFKYEDGVYRFGNGEILSVDRANTRFYYARACTDQEIADYEAAELRWAAEDAAAEAAALAEAAPAA